MSTYQDILSLVITSFILRTSMFEQVVIMFREISFLSLLGLKGLGGGVLCTHNFIVKCVIYHTLFELTIYLYSNVSLVGKGPHDS